VLDVLPALLQPDDAATSIHRSIEVCHLLKGM
jgi:hypothetical protein